jgi:hypothetical protein
MQLKTDSILHAFDGTLALIDDQSQRERFGHLLEASRPAVDQAAYGLIGEVVGAVNATLGDDARVDLTYTAEGIDVAVTRLEPGDAGFAATGDDVERLTLRLPAAIKAHASALAAEAAVSLNTWIVTSLARAVARATEEDAHDRKKKRRGRRSRRTGSSLRGRVGS